MIAPAPDNWKFVMDSLHPVCDWPVIYAMGRCCGSTPCRMLWRRSCDDNGGCYDRATCGGCEEPYLPEDEKASTI